MDVFISEEYVARRHESKKLQKEQEEQRQQEQRKRLEVAIADDGQEEGCKSNENTPKVDADEDDHLFSCMSPS